MTLLAKLLFNINRIVLLLLVVAFLSFFLLTFEGMDFIKPVADYATKYLPLLLIPVLIAMVVVLLLRYLAKGKDEKLAIGDFLAGLIAVVMQVATLIVYRAQGHEIAGSLAANIPNVDILVEQAQPYGMLGVAALQFLAFGFYWFADPDPKHT